MREDKRFSLLHCSLQMGTMTFKIQNLDEHMKLAKHTFSYFLNTHIDKKGSICLPSQPLLHEGIEELLQSSQHGRHLQQSHKVLGQALLASLHLTTQGFRVPSMHGRSCCSTLILLLKLGSSP